MAGRLGLQACECAQEDVDAWIEGTHMHRHHSHTCSTRKSSVYATEKRKESLPVPPPSIGGVVQGEEDVPFIPINQYRQVFEPLQQPSDGEVENMADQVSNVFPHIPRHIILMDLSEFPSAIGELFICVCVCVCVRACVRVCVRACVRACVRVWSVFSVYLSDSPNSHLHRSNSECGCNCSQHCGRQSTL